MGLLRHPRRWWLLLLRRLAAWRGYTLVKQAEHAEVAAYVRRLELASTSLGVHLRTVLQRVGADRCLDVGANRGQFHDLLREEARFTGPIESYEPEPGLVQGLVERAAADPGWRVHGVGLAAKEGALDLQVMEFDPCTSFRQPGPSQPGSLAEGNRVRRVVRVPVRTLGGELARLRAEAPAARLFLKMDTQGFDLEVLAGAGPEALRSVVALQSEVSLVPTYVGAPRWLEALARYEALGFQVTGLFPVWHDPDTGRVVEFDAVLVRPEAVLPSAREPASRAGPQAAE